MYELYVEVHILGYGRSDSARQRCGIRTIHSVIDPETNGHTFLVNGCKVRPSLASDQMLSKGRAAWQQL